MQLRHPAIIAGQKARQGPGHETAHAGIQPPHDAEIHRHQPAFPVQEEISRMHVGMEKAVAQRLGEETAHQGQRDASWDHGPRRAPGRGIADRRAVDPFAGEHPRRGARPIHMRHAEFGVAAGAIIKLGCRRRFHAQVQFQRHRSGQGLDQRDNAQPPRFAGKALAPRARTRPARRRSRREQRLDPGTQHLDRRFHAFAGGGAMHLGDGGRRDRRAERRKQALDRTSRNCRAITSRAAASEKGGSRSCRCSSARRHLFADNIGPRRQHLAQLDIGGSQPLQACARRSRRLSRDLPKPRRARAKAIGATSPAAGV